MQTINKTELFQGFYSEIEQAFKNKDLETISRFTAPEWTGWAPDGSTVTREQLMQNVQKMFDTVDILSWSRKVTNVEEDGGHYDVTAGDVLRTKNKAGEIEEKNLNNVDTWFQSPEGWVIVRSRPAE
jgi:hypothetical protein